MPVPTDITEDIEYGTTSRFIVLRSNYRASDLSRRCAVILVVSRLCESAHYWLALNIDALVHVMSVLCCVTISNRKRLLLERAVHVLQIILKNVHGTRVFKLSNLRVKTHFTLADLVEDWDMSSLLTSVCGAGFDSNSGPRRLCVLLDRAFFPKNDLSGVRGLSSSSKTKIYHCPRPIQKPAGKKQR